MNKTLSYLIAGGIAAVAIILMLTGIVGIGPGLLILMITGISELMYLFWQDNQKKPDEPAVPVTPE